MSVKASVRYLTLLATVWRAAEVTSSKVSQFPKEQIVRRGDNASTSCTFPISQATPDVSWWRWGEKSFIQQDSRKQNTVKKGSATFTLLNASVADSGIYYCKVQYQKQFIGVGPGSHLTVFAPPTPLIISAVEETSPPRKLVCKTAAFYPEKLEISWLRNGVTILTGIEEAKNKSVEELFEASSFLEITPPMWGNDVYTCLVSHESLPSPARVDYTVWPGSHIALILGCALVGLANLVLMIILTILRLKVSRDVNTNSMEPSQSAEPARQAPVEHTTGYATLNLRADKGFTKGRREEEHVIYSQTKGGGADKLTYAALNLPKSNKTSAPKHKDNHTVYAGVNTSKRTWDYE